MVQSHTVRISAVRHIPTSRTAWAGFYRQADLSWEYVTNSDTRSDSNQAGTGGSRSAMATGASGREANATVSVSA
jgi:hypothetical protein